MLPDPGPYCFLRRWSEVSLFVCEQLQQGLSLRRIGRLSQNFAVVGKILFVNVAIHSRPRIVEAGAHDTSAGDGRQSPKGAVISPTCTLVIRTW